MKTISSAEFRKTYPRLDEPVSVTANGHVIGAWVPAKVGTTIEFTRDLSPKAYGSSETLTYGHSTEHVKISTRKEVEARHLKADLAGEADSRAMQRNLDADIHAFNSRPFTPVPKG